MSTLRHWVLLGPTCSWKSETALALAQATGSEIISCDSMQVYKGLAIGTAQPSPQQQSQIPHHLIGCMDIHERYDANIFLAKCNDQLKLLEQQGKTAVIVGGTGLYSRALVYGHTLLPSDKETADAIRLKNETLTGHQELLDWMAKAAGGMEQIPQDLRLNPRHFTRACEVLKLTGQLPWQLNPSSTSPSPRFSQLILLPDFQLLKERIRKRTHAMLEAGWIQEAKQAFDQGLLETPTARQALGYQEIAQFLQRGHSPCGNDLETVLANRTIQYARRQMTWFNHQHPGATLLHPDSAENAGCLVLSRTVLQ